MFWIWVITVSSTKVLVEQDIQVFLSFPPLSLSLSLSYISPSPFFSLCMFAGNILKGMPKKIYAEQRCRRSLVNFLFVCLFVYSQADSGHCLSFSLSLLTFQPVRRDWKINFMVGSYNYLLIRNINFFPTNLQQNLERKNKYINGSSSVNHINNSLVVPQ